MPADLKPRARMMFGSAGPIGADVISPTRPPARPVYAAPPRCGRDLWSPGVITAGHACSRCATRGVEDGRRMEGGWTQHGGEDDGDNLPLKAGHVT